MKYYHPYFSIVIFLGLLCCLTMCQSSPDQSPLPRIIFDTDFGGDADDLGALAMLNHFVNKQEIELLAVMCWNTERYAVSAIDAVNTFYGNPAIPIGQRVGEIHETPWNHSKILTEHLAFDATRATTPQATSLYRQLLSESPDMSVTIVTVGPLSNIQHLLASDADDFSPLSGRKLVHAKVKEFVIMGGQFPSGKNEWNFNGDMPGVTLDVLTQLSLPITFSGFELGDQLKTGEVFNDLPKDHPFYLGFYHFSQYAPWTKDQFENRIHDNSTFDQTAVLYAARGGVGEYWTRVEGGFCQADSTGGNTWVPQEGSLHAYLVLKKPVEEMEVLLEALMLGAF